MVTISQKEFPRGKVIENAAGGGLSVREVSRLLPLSERHVQGLKRRYRPDSVAWVQHGNRGHSTPRALSPSQKQLILSLLFVEDHVLLRGFGFQGLEPLAKGFQVMPRPEAPHPRRGNEQTAIGQLIGHPHLTEGRLFRLYSSFNKGGTAQPRSSESLTKYTFRHAAHYPKVVDRSACYP